MFTWVKEPEDEDAADRRRSLWPEHRDEVRVNDVRISAGAWRYFGIVVAALMAINSLFELPDYPLWSLAVFGLSLWILNGLTRGWSADDAWVNEPVGPARESPRPPV